jgi:hypothetical protein
MPVALCVFCRSKVTRDRPSEPFLKRMLAPFSLLLLLSCLVPWWFGQIFSARTVAALWPKRNFLASSSTTGWLLIALPFS